MYRDTLRRTMIAINVIDGIYYTLAKKSGVKENTLTLLYALDDGRPHSQKEICEQWFMPKTTLNTIVKECAAAGYVYLDGSSHTKEKDVCLTPAGQAYAAQILAPIYALEERAMAEALGGAPGDFIRPLERFTDHLKSEARTYEPTL